MTLTLEYTVGYCKSDDDDVWGGVLGHHGIGDFRESLGAQAPC